MDKTFQGMGFLGQMIKENAAKAAALHAKKSSVNVVGVQDVEDNISVADSSNNNT
jgi:hypothetical protein